MTCREKLMKEHPEKVSKEYNGGCAGCPSTYGYLPNPKWCNSSCNCTMCWDREIPENVTYVNNLTNLAENVIRIKNKLVYDGDFKPSEAVETIQIMLLEGYFKEEQNNDI